MRPKKKHNENEGNFWISATDMMAGILMVVLLLLMLFILYLNMSTDRVFTINEATEATDYGATSDEYDYRWVHYDDDDDDDHRYDHYSSGGGGGGQDETHPTEETTVSSDDGDEYGRDKTAVFVTVVDDDTGNTIKKAGTEFELYADKNGIGGLQTLYTYYPYKTEYKKFSTTLQGTFYLPEKITRGWYSLHNVEPPEGYYIDENTDFEIDDYWDWPEPFMVEVRMKPIKSAVRIQVNDADTTEPVENVVYQVIASEDITSIDGTVRLKKGEIADEITTDIKGYAESKELYIGNYTLKQVGAPEYYALNKVSSSASVFAEMAKNTEIVSIECRKTKLILNLTDERTQEPIKGAVYTIEGRADMETDANGEFTVTDLEKEVKYTLTLSSLPEGYRKVDPEIEFTVDNAGLINGSASYTYDDTAYTISLSAGITDVLFGRMVVGTDLVLTDTNGNIVDEWTSSGEEHIISGLDSGEYNLSKPNDKDVLGSIDLKDTAELQKLTVKTWDTVDLYAVLIAAGSIILAVIITGMLIRRKKARKKHE